MPTLSKDLRRILEKTVADAREIAEAGAEQALRQLTIDRPESRLSGTAEEMARERSLRQRLRAHGKQLGDRREPNGAQELRRLRQACAYEHWHRMLFARFLAENSLLIHPEYGQAISLLEIKELAREQNADWLSIAASYAQKMLLGVFRSDDPVLELSLPPETRLALDEKLQGLPAEIFMADDSLGWVYQFWQRDEKDRVNKSEVKIGADELPAVTQLFTEDYMVLFLLENTLGAWWTAKCRTENKDPALPGYTFSYLRLNEDGSPVAGSFDGWPRTAKELRVLDPCMGSGHFLTFALPILARMRMEEEDLALKDALFAVLKDNLFGLELDTRCAQIAAFNLALAVWRMEGQHFVLPELNLACCGIGPNATKDQWIKLGEEIAARGGMPADVNLFGMEDSLLSEPVKRTMESLHELFSQAPILGSLIDPSKLRVDLFQTDYKTVAPLISAVLKAEQATEETRERVIAAAGMVKAASLLAGRYTLVITNVPYLGRGKQEIALQDYCDRHYPESKSDLATCFLERCIALSSARCSIAVVTPQSWLFMGTYKKLRSRILASLQWDSVARLGPGAFETISGDVVNVALLGFTRNASPSNHTFCGIDVAKEDSPAKKALSLRTSLCEQVNQSDQVANPDSRISFRTHGTSERLSKYCSSFIGLGTGDYSHYGRNFWEFPGQVNGWAFQQCTVESPVLWGGREHMVAWDHSIGRVRGMTDLERIQIHNQDQSGQQAWGHQGVAVGLMQNLRPTLYTGETFEKALAVLLPHSEDLIPAIWAYCSDPSFNEAVRELEHGVIVANGTLVKIPFDLAHWKRVAADKYPCGLPKPFSSNPTQWLFEGQPKGSESPLQVALARLVGYQWPRQTGSSFVDCPALGSDGLENFAAEDGIVPLSSIAGMASAADRLRTLLATAYGEEWSAAKLAELLGDNASLESWLRDRFFEEHCELFQQRPFVWHVWDGRRDGFHALVNYHKLAAPNGEGRKTIEKLIYTTLGDWITRQRADVVAGVDGADGRLAAAEHLRGQLEKILQGESPYDIFVRWKPLDQQPTGWEPDINDGVRMNIRPWLTATTHQSGRRDGCILRVTPKIKYGKDRGKEPLREKEDFPWFWTWDEKTDDFAGGAEFDGARRNDLHYSVNVKSAAREWKKAQKKGG